MFLGCTFFFWSYAFPHAAPTAWFAHPPSAFVLDPVDLWSLLTSQASYLITLPLPVCSPCCWHLGGYPSPEQFREVAMSTYFEGFWDGQWALLTSGLSYDEHVTCFSGVAVSHVDKGQTFLVWIEPLFLLFPGPLIRAHHWYTWVESSYVVNTERGHVLGIQRL